MGIKITDPFSGQTFIGPADRATAAVESWYPDPPAEVRQALDVLCGTWTYPEEVAANRSRDGWPRSFTTLPAEWTDAVAFLGLTWEVVEHMDPAELDDIRTILGVSDTWLAERLGVRRDTVKKWRQGDDDIPYRVPSELAAALRAFAQVAHDCADRLDG